MITSEMTFESKEQEASVFHDTQARRLSEGWERQKPMKNLVYYFCMVANFKIKNPKFFVLCKTKEECTGCP